MVQLWLNHIFACFYQILAANIQKAQLTELAVATEQSRIDKNVNVGRGKCVRNCCLAVCLFWSLAVAVK
jgi:hypothetical protein